MHAVADRGHGDLTEDLDAGFARVTGGTSQVDAYGTLNAIVVLVTI